MIPDGSPELNLSNRLKSDRKMGDIYDNFWRVTYLPLSEKYYKQQTLLYRGVF